MPPAGAAPLPAAHRVCNRIHSRAANVRPAAQVALPPGRQLLGFGAGDIAYLVRKDEFDLRWVERYRIVRSGG